jgi:ABC-type bacteriocin/lantibiotic exporter with double-glycine peptidase domain
MIRLVLKLLSFEKKKFFLLFLTLTIFVSWIESLSLLLIFSYFANDGFIYKQIQKFNITKNEILNLILFIFVFKFFLLNFNSFSKNWFINKFTYKNSNFFFKKFINKELIFYTSNRSSNFIKDIWYSVKNLTTAYSALLTALSELIIFIFLILILLFFNFEITIMLLIVGIFISFLFILVFKKKIQKLGEQKNIQTSDSIGYLQEAFNFIREIKIFNLNYFYLKKIDKTHRAIHKTNTESSFIQEIPKNSFELFVIGLIFFFFNISYFFQIQYFKFDNEYLIFLIISSYRFVPGFLRLISFYNVFNNFKFDIETLVRVASDKEIISSNNKINFSKSIKFKNITFKYKNQEKEIFNNLNLNLIKNKKYFLKGESGLGKSTFVDILSGLIQPSSGNIIVDNKITNLNSYDWHKKISYMSQNNTLFDSSVLENIVLQDFPDKIDLNRLNYALKVSNSLNFINKLNNKLNYFAGEKGRRLSSGQIQRIILARCLYKKSDILILDEFLSSLDEKNSKIILKLISEIRNKTILIILHKYKKLEFVDYVIDLNKKNIYIEKIKIKAKN